MDEATPPPAPLESDPTAAAFVTQAITFLQAAKAKLQPEPLPTPVQQFNHFIEHFHEKPVKSTVKLSAFLAIIALLVFLVFLLVADFRRAKANEQIRRENQSYVAQTQALDEVKANINSLLDFVQAQKTRLQESEDIVNSLRSEQEKLGLVVATNRQIIDAILDQQSQKARADVWHDQVISFISGLVSGVIGSIIAFYLLRFLSNRKTSPPNSALPPTQAY